MWFTFLQRLINRTNRRNWCIAMIVVMQIVYVNQNNDEHQLSCTCVCIRYISAKLKYTHFFYRIIQNKKICIL